MITNGERNKNSCYFTMIYVWTLTSFTHTLCDTDLNSWCDDLRMNKLKNTVPIERRMYNVPYEKERMWCYCGNNYTFHIIKFLSVFFLFDVSLCICVCTDMYLGTVRSYVVIASMLFFLWIYTKPYVWHCLDFNFSSKRKKNSIDFNCL